MALSIRSVRILAGAYAALLTAGSLLPSGPDAPGGWDRSITPTLQNAMHAPAYALLAVLVTLSVKAQDRRSALGAVLLSAAACCACGVLLEFAQAYVPGRTASLWDALVNAVGAAAGIACMGIVRLIRGPRRVGDDLRAATSGQGKPGRALKA